ncbi:MAG: GNAT family N-acetyltransferase [Ignavibacteriaceae bacterium]|nr:GNAT family N-acetyltransferase [Ignavibacteriaceae bacterium]
MEAEVIHEKENERFVIYLDGNEVYVEYTMAGKEINLYHTYTHPALRGKGLAAQVVRAAFEFAKKNNLKIVPTCSYTQAFLTKNDEYKDLVAE